MHFCSYGVEQINKLCPQINRLCRTRLCLPLMMVLFLRTPQDPVDYIRGVQAN